MPNQPRSDNPTRYIRIDTGLWERVEQARVRHGARNASTIVRLALRMFCDDDERETAA